MKHFFFFIILTLGLAACSGANAAPAPLPTVALDSGSDSPAVASSSSGGVTASGVVSPSGEATLAFGIAGRISVVHVAEGDPVKKGDLLAELENTAQQIELAQAQLALSQLQSPAALALAEQTLANAQKTLEDAQKKVDAMQYKRATDVKIENLQSEIDLAEEALSRAQQAYKSVARMEDGSTKKATALYNMTNAQLRLNDLLAQYNWLTGKPTETDAAIILANFSAAKAAKQEAEWHLAALKGETLPNEASGSKLAAIANAKNAVALAQERLAATQLFSPIDGQVISLGLSAGEYALPGQQILLLSNITILKVETTDLSEKDVVKVSVGQTVSVFVDALGETIGGKVISISPVATTLGGDVVYKTTIALDKPYPENLRAGMSVDVSFEK